MAGFARGFAEAVQRRIRCRANHPIHRANGVEVRSHLYQLLSMAAECSI